jgi:hypothetical protein
MKKAVLPGTGSRIRCLFDPWIQDPGCVKNQNPEPGYGTGMNSPDYISESFEVILWVKILKFIGADPGSGMEKFRSGIRYEKTRIRDLR